MMHESADQFADQVRALADGPHSPEQTVEVARTIEEAARVLVYATRADAGIGYAATVYDLVGALNPSVRSIRRVIEQGMEWLKRHDAENALTVDNGSPYALPDVYHAGARTAVVLGTLVTALEDLHACLAVIGGPAPSEDDS